MPKTQISTHQRLSSDYLQSLWDKGVCFSFDAEDLISLAQANDEPTTVLVMFAQGLNLEKLFKVQQALAPVLQISCYKPGNLVAQSIAYEADVQVLDAQHLQAKLEQVSVENQLELSVLSHRPTLAQPGLLLMDMDSTVIGVECIDEIAKLAGVGEQVSKVTELAMQGKLDFAESLTQRVGCLQGTHEHVLNQVRDALPIMQGIESLLVELKAAGWKLAIASGGFTYFADYLRDRLCLDFAISNQLEIVDGVLTGKVTGDIVTAQTKAQTLVNLAQQWQIPLQQTVALGDGANDLVMMEQAGLGAALHAKPVVRQQADSAIRFGSADTLLAYLKRS